MVSSESSPLPLLRFAFFASLPLCLFLCSPLSLPVPPYPILQNSPSPPLLTSHLGIPARPHGDGPDGHCLWPAMKAIPNEFLELYYPLRIDAYHLEIDSGGPGLYRGG